MGKTFEYSFSGRLKPEHSTTQFSFYCQRWESFNTRWLIRLTAFYKKQYFSSSHFEQIFKKLKPVQEQLFKTRVDITFQQVMSRPSYERVTVSGRGLIEKSVKLSKICKFEPNNFMAAMGKNIENSFSGRLRTKHLTSHVSFYCQRWESFNIRWLNRLTAFYKRNMFLE